MTSARLGNSSRTKIAGMESAHPDTSDAYNKNTNSKNNSTRPDNIVTNSGSGSGSVNGNGSGNNPRYHDTDNPALDTRPHFTPMSHGGLTSSSAYGSGYSESSSPAKYPSSSYTSNKQGFNGFGGNFGERSAIATGRSASGRARGGFPPGFAPASGGGVEAALSSNAFAGRHSQNCGNVITGRPSSRVTAPPGGHSTFSLG